MQWNFSTYACLRMPLFATSPLEQVYRFTSHCSWDDVALKCRTCIMIRQFFSFKDLRRISRKMKGENIHRDMRRKSRRAQSLGLKCWTGNWCGLRTQGLRREDISFHCWEEWFREGYFDIADKLRTRKDLGWRTKYTPHSSSLIYTRILQTACWFQLHLSGLLVL